MPKLRKTWNERNLDEGILDRMCKTEGKVVGWGEWGEQFSCKRTKVSSRQREQNLPSKMRLRTGKELRVFTYS